MAAAALSPERRRGSAGWLVIRAVPRRMVLLGWFAAFVLLLAVGLLPGAVLAWLTVAAPASDVGDAVAVPGAADRRLGRRGGGRGARPAAGSAARSVARRAADRAGHRRGSCSSPCWDWRPDLAAAPAPGAGLAILGDLPNAARPVADALRASGSSLVVAAVALVLAIAGAWTAPTCERASRPCAMHPAAAWAVLVVASLGVFLGGAELMVVAIALPSIVADFGGWADLARASWIVNALPAGLHRGHAAGRPRGRPVGRPPPVRGGP